MLNVNFKVVTKFLPNILTIVVDIVVKPSKTSFLSGTNILEGVVVLRETVHELHKQKSDGVILNLTLRRRMTK